jgi:GNAT superfamily N-acetyltransferase
LKTVIADLPRAALPEATALLAAACPFDPAAVVAEEKLFGPAPPPHESATLGHRRGTALAGVAVVSGRWLRLLAVHPDHRGRGVASALLDAASARARAWGATRLRTGDQPGNYLAPGVDARNADALAFAARRGFREVGRNENLAVPLVDNDRVTPARAAELAAAATSRGYTVRRASADDARALLDFAGAAFSPSIAFEVERALAPARPDVHIALTATGSIIAFGCHDGNNRGLGWFGPAGTAVDHRGAGLGQALLLPCLLDIAAAGHAEGTIAWIGPRAYYERAAGARASRAFVVLERALA